MAAPVKRRGRKPGSKNEYVEATVFFEPEDHKALHMALINGDFPDELQFYPIKSAPDLIQQVILLTGTQKKRLDVLVKKARDVLEGKSVKPSKIMINKMFLRLDGGEYAEDHPVLMKEMIIVNSNPKTRRGTAAYKKIMTDFISDYLELSGFDSLDMAANRGFSEWINEFELDESDPSWNFVTAAEELESEGYKNYREKVETEGGRISGGAVPLTRVKLSQKQRKEMLGSGLFKDIAKGLTSVASAVVPGVSLVKPLLDDAIDAIDDSITKKKGGGLTTEQRREIRDMLKTILDKSSSGAGVELSRAELSTAALKRRKALAALKKK